MNILNKLSYALKKNKINNRGSRIRFRKGAWILVPAFSIAMFMPVATPVQADSFPDAGFEDGTFTGWSKGNQSGTLGNTITGKSNLGYALAAWMVIVMIVAMSGYLGLRQISERWRK